MKKSTLLLALLFLGFSVGFLGCGGGGNAPSNTVTKGLNAFYDEDFETVVLLYAKKDGTKLTKEEQAKLQGMMPLALQQQAEKEGMKNIEILEEEIDENGDEAEVTYKITFNNGDEDTEEIDLIRIDGEWYMVIGN